MTRSGVHWDLPYVSYSFNYNSTAGNALDATFQSWVNIAIQTIEEMFGFDFVQYSGPASITINGSRGDGTYAYGTWYTPANNLQSGQLFFDQSWTTNQSSSLFYGSYGLLTIIHELLHAIGLEHPGYYNVTGGYFTDALFQQDTHRYSIMSYFHAASDGSGTSHWAKNGNDWVWIYPQTPMVYDLLALTDGNFAGLFAGYNLNPTTRAGDTTYGYNATPGINSVLNFAINGSPVLTIYDAGGVDTLDLSGDVVTSTGLVTYDANGAPVATEAVRTSSVIDIRPGQYSSTHGMTNNIGVAFNTIIENVIGTRFDDTIFGNYWNNVLSGESGNDNINGGDGADIIDGGVGADVLDGGGNIGGDTVSYFTSVSGVHINLGRGIYSGGTAEGDTLSNFQNIIGSNYDDILNASFNGAMEGHAGNDFLYGWFSQTATGGAGMDWFVFMDDRGGPGSAGIVMDYSTEDVIYLGGSDALPSFSVQGPGVFIGNIWLDGAGASDVTIVTQKSTLLLNDTNKSSIRLVLGQGASALGAFGEYNYNTFDTNFNDVWTIIVSAYTSANILDYILTTYDPEQLYHSLNSDHDQSASGNWSRIDTYYSAASVIDFKWLAYDTGQPLYAASIDFDQTTASSWSEIQSFYSAAGVTDFSYVYYDAGQPLHSSATDYDQTLAHSWSRIETFFSTAATTDFYWAYYDAGQPYFAATVDYDQTSSNTWSQIQTFFSSAGVTDFTWAYFDAGQPLYARLVDYDQGNLYAWNQHIVEYDTSTHVLNDYYI